MADGLNTKNYKRGTYHMVGRDEYEPQRTNNFELQITGLAGLKQFDDDESGISDSNVPSNISDQLTLSIDSFGAPNFNVSQIEVPYANNKVKYAGVPNYEGGSIQFNDFLGMNTERLLMAWFKEVYNPRNQKVGRASRYKKTAYLIEYDPSGEYSRVWQINGCWISSLDLGSFAQGTNDVRKINCTFQYDHCFPLDNDTKFG